MVGFDFEEERVRQEITKRAVKRVLIQLPEGLKPEGPRLAEIIEGAGATPIISGDPCYGACDLAVNEAEALGVDLIIHFGHAMFLKENRVPTLYVPAKANVIVNKAVEQALPLLSDYIRIALATTVQHLDMLESAKQVLLKADKKVIIVGSRQMGYLGQVIGCDYSNVKSIAAEVDAFLFVGGGIFHALGIALSTLKPTVIADPYDNRAFSIGKEAQKILKQHWASVQQAVEAKTFGVLVGLKPGQQRLDQALKVKGLIEKRGKSALLFAMREVTPEVLAEFPTIDAYVNTACQRISLDAPGKFPKPVLTINELKVAIGEASWDSMLKEGLFEN